MLRAYSPELTGWFDDFGHSGFPDAFGGIGRISTTLNTFSVGAPSAGVPCNSIVEILQIPGGYQRSASCSTRPSSPRTSASRTFSAAPAPTSAA